MCGLRDNVFHIEITMKKNFIQDLKNRAIKLKIPSLCILLV